MDNPPPAWGIRRGPWKLMQIMREGEPKLFNLEADVSEMNDVAGDHPELVRELRTDFVKWLQIAREPIGWNRAYYDELKALH